MLKRVLIIILVAITLSVVPAGVISGSNADKAIEYLRSANMLRTERAQEEQAWLLERERQQLLLETLADELERVETKQAALRSELAALEAERPPEVAEKTNQLEALMSELTSLVQAALEKRLPTLPPGALPTPLIEGATPAEMLASAMKTMSEAERRAGQVSIELVEGTLGTEVRSVELLRLGGLAAWWSSLDGTEGGTATMRDGKLSLELASDGTVQQAISQAIRIARGRAAPSLVTLPYQPISVGREVGQ